MRTELDDAHSAMDASPEDDRLRLRFFERLADSEVFLLLTTEPSDDKAEPQLFDVEDGRYALVFDREERLAAFVGAQAPYLALSGRMLCRMLAGQGVGLGLNLEVAPSAMLIPQEAVDWLDQTLAKAPDEVAAVPVEVSRPSGLPEDLLSGIDRKLASGAGLADWAGLVRVTYNDNRRGHLLAIAGAKPEAEAPLASAIGEALTFSGVDAGELDVVFVAAGSDLAQRVARVGLCFDMTAPEPEKARTPAAPGMDPDRPPRLR